MVDGARVLSLHEETVVLPQRRSDSVLVYKIDNKMVTPRDWPSLERRSTCCVDAAMRASKRSSATWLMYELPASDIILFIPHYSTYAAMTQALFVSGGP